MDAGSTAARRRAAAMALAVVLTGCDETPGPLRARATPPPGPRTVAPRPKRNLDAAGVLEEARASVVGIECLDRHGRLVVQGSGVLVAKGTIVTSWPLVSRAFAIRVRQGDLSGTARIDAVSERAALARLSGEFAGAVELGRDTDPGPGAAAHAVGVGIDGVASTEGIVTVAAENGPGWLDTTMPMPLAFTGGGVFDQSATLIGIALPGRPGEAHSHAVPARLVKDLLALPAGSLPKVLISPLQRLPAPDRDWLRAFMAKTALEGRVFSSLGLERVHALLDRLDPLVGQELERVKLELGLGLLAQQRLFWEDAIEARTFGRAVRSARRAAIEKELVEINVFTEGELRQAAATMRKIAAREPFDTSTARVEATEIWLTQMITQTDRTRRRIEAQVWEARSRVE